MVKFVMKRNGDKSPLDEKKVLASIASAAQEAGFDREKALSIAAEVSKMALNSFGDDDTVSTRELKTNVVTELDASYPEVAAAWRQYDQSHGKQ